MPFQRLEVPKYPPRFWSLVGFPGVGKSSFCATLTPPLLVVDADHRFGEVTHLVSGDVFKVDAANNGVEAICSQVRANIVGSGVKTIIVDSLTAILTPLVAQAILDNDAGKNKNRIGAFKSKALAMRLLQDTLTATGCDVVWVYHYRDGRDEKAQSVTSTSISQTELIRLRRSQNAILRIDVAPDGARRITCEWARRGRQGWSLIDESGTWAGMVTRIEQCLYDGLTSDQMEAIEHTIPTSFPSKEAALSWGFEQGCFRDAVHAENAYLEVKRVHQPKHSSEMWRLWIEEVTSRSTNPFDDPTMGVNAKIPA